MPKPIPDWDLARRIVKLLGGRQLSGKETTMRELSRAMGIGRNRIISVLNEKKVVFSIIPHKEAKYYDILVLKNIPINLAQDAEISIPDILKTHDEFMRGERVERKVKKKRATRKELEKLKIKNFWERKDYADETVQTLSPRN